MPINKNWYVKLTGVAALFVSLIIIAWPSSRSASGQLPTYKIYLPSVARTPGKRCVATSILYFQHPVTATQQIKDLGINCSYLYTQANSFTDTSIDMAGTIGWNDPDTTFIGGTSNYFIGWNEPDLNPLATPALAAIKWKTVVASNSSKIPVSPGPSQLNPGWLSLFRDAYILAWGTPPPLGVLAIHCYGTPSACKSVVSQVIGYSQAWNIPEVWVTEFGTSPEWSATWEEDALDFINWMNAQPKITRYYWWATAYPNNDPCCPWAAGFHTQLYDWSTGQLTAPGIFYRDLY